MWNKTLKAITNLDGVERECVILRFYETEENDYALVAYKDGSLCSILIQYLKVSTDELF